MASTTYALTSGSTTCTIPTLTAWDIMETWPDVTITTTKDVDTIDASAHLHPVDVDLLATGQALDDLDMARETVRLYPQT